MNNHQFDFCSTTLTALPSGALWHGAARVLTVSDLHLGKSNRIARRNGTMLPPYETQDTLLRLEADIGATQPETVICLGDSFDDNAAASELAEDVALWITRLQAGRRWIWIVGNHDPGAAAPGGSHAQDYVQGSLTYRHIAKTKASGEISGHYHPKKTLHVRGCAITRACFLVDQHRVIMPAYGTYTGGLRSNSDVLSNLMQKGAKAILTGKTATAVPM